MIVMARSEKEMHDTLGLALRLVQAKGGTLNVDTRLTITYTPGPPHELVIVRHSDEDRTVLHALWAADDGKPPEFVVWLPSAWLLILRRAGIVAERRLMMNKLRS